MIRYRPFLNHDPPAIAEIWRSQPPQRGLVQPMSPQLFEHLVLSKSYFDRFGLMLAVEGDHPIGFVHAGFGPSSKLSAISVLNINLGVDRPRISDQHWIYYPEDQFIFSRVGFPMNFSSSVAPKDTSSMYVEITHQQWERLSVEEAFERAWTDLQKCGILRKDDRILTRQIIDLKFGYVVFDQHRQTHLQNLIDYLQSRGVHTAGRYGRWDYFSMEDSILSGKSVAEQILT